MKRPFKKLSEPIRIGSMVPKNRIWLSPLWTRLASVNGEVTQLVIDHYVARAQGGAGAITQESTAVDGRHVWFEPELRIDNDCYGPGLHRIVEAVHMFNTPIICQLHNSGMFGTDPISPAGVACFDLGMGHYIQPRVLSYSEIEEAREMFIRAARRAKIIGYDGVELHGGTSYLLEQFISPHTNKRTDKYGGPIENRMLLALEIIRGIRKECGLDFPVGYTLIDSDLQPHGINIEEALIFAKNLEREGISYVDLQSRGTYETFHFEESRGSCMRQKKGQFDIAAVFKKELTVPVTTRAAGHKDPRVWEDAVSKGQVDAIRVGRQFLADPDFAKKVLNGDIENVRPCIHELNCLETGVMKPWNLTCGVNYELGKGERVVEPSATPQKVLVIGGGPAGLEAARVSALRGHKVTLLEKRSELGGNLVTASLPIGKDDINKFIGWAERQCRNLGVRIEVNVSNIDGFIKEIKPDAVIVATGACPMIPRIPGIDKPHVVVAEDVLKNKATVKGKVIVLGGGMVGVETADFIIENDLAKDVTIVEMLPEIAADMNPLEKGYLFVNIIPKLGLKMMTNMKAEEITDRCLVVIDSKWRRHELAADTIVLAVGYYSDQSVYDSLKDRIGKVYIVGDGLKPRRAVNAIHEGHFVARQI
ncbi:MAG: FAD-dependent oxidoreductase [Syntrophales bacterium]